MSCSVQLRYAILERLRHVGRIGRAISTIFTGYRHIDNWRREKTDSLSEELFESVSWVSGLGCWVVVVCEHVLRPGGLKESMYQS